MGGREGRGGRGGRDVHQRIVVGHCWVGVIRSVMCTCLSRAARRRRGHGWPGACTLKASKVRPSCFPGLLIDEMSDCRLNNGTPSRMSRVISETMESDRQVSQRRMPRCRRLGRTESDEEDRRRDRTYDVLWFDSFARWSCWPSGKSPPMPSAPLPIDGDVVVSTWCFNVSSTKYVLQLCKATRESIQC